MSTSRDPLSGYTSTPPPGAGGPPPVVAFGGPVAGRYTLAGWWRRVGAHVIDGLIIGVLALVLLVAITAPFSIGFFVNDTVGVGAVIATSRMNAITQMKAASIRCAPTRRHQPDSV